MCNVILVNKDKLNNGASKFSVKYGNKSADIKLLIVWQLPSLGNILNKQINFLLLYWQSKHIQMQFSPTTYK